MVVRALGRRHLCPFQPPPKATQVSLATCCIATCLADPAHPWAELSEDRAGVWTAAS